MKTLIILVLLPILGQAQFNMDCEKYVNGHSQAEDEVQSNINNSGIDPTSLRNWCIEKMDNSNGKKEHYVKGDTNWDKYDGVESEAEKEERLAQEAQEAEGAANAAEEKRQADAAEQKEENCNTEHANLVTYVKGKSGGDVGPDTDGPAILVAPNVYCKKTEISVDYSICQEAVNIYNVGYVGTQGVEIAGQVQRMEAQKDATMMVASPNQVQTTAVDATKRIVAQEQKIETQQSVTHGAIAAGVGQTLARWPTSKNWIEDCGGDYNGNCETLKKCIGKEISTSEMFPNSRIKDFFIAKTVEHAGQATMHGVLAGQYKKQKGMLQDVGDDMRQFADMVDANAPSLVDCRANPQLPGCSGGSGMRQTGVIQGGGIEFGSPDAINGKFNPESLDKKESNLIGGTGLSDADKGLINTGLEDFSDKSGKSAVDNAPGAAKFQLGSGAPSLSNTPGVADTEKDKNSLVSSKSRLGYAKGGKGIQRAPSSSSGSQNPFAGLLGKKEESKGGVKVDRGMASEIAPEASGLFKKISKRYGKVLKEKRIEEEKI